MICTVQLHKVYSLNEDFAAVPLVRKNSPCLQEQPRGPVLEPFSQGDRHLSNCQERCSGFRAESTGRKMTASRRGRRLPRIRSVGSERDLLPVVTQNRVVIPRILPSKQPSEPEGLRPTASPGEIRSSAPRALRETVDAPAHRRTSVPSPAQPGAALTLSRHFRARMRRG